MTINHLGSDSAYKAVWGRSSDYRKKAIQGIKAKHERLDVYNNDLLLQATLSRVRPKPLVSGAGKITQLQPGCPAHTARYKLDKFTDGKSPYPNHAHHMIPANAFINRFTSDQRDILLRIDYDVNNGNNMIYLPSRLDCTSYHLLPWHQTDDYHNPYSNEVKNAATKIEDKINKQIDEKKPCETQDPPADIAEELVRYENLLWKVIVGLGPKSINEVEVPRQNVSWGGLG